MKQIKETVQDLSAVFVILFVTLILTVNYSIVQLYYPSIISWASMPLIVELAVRKGSIRNLGFQKTNFRRSLPLTLGLIIVWLLTFLFVPKIMGKTLLPAQSLLLLPQFSFIQV